MKIEDAKNYGGEYVEITAPVQETTVLTPDSIGGEIWYN